MVARNFTLIFFVFTAFIILAGGQSVVFAGAVRVFGDDNFNHPIPAPDEPDGKLGKGWMNDATITINEHLPILDLDVETGLEHTQVFDLNIFLKGPSGKTVYLNDYNVYKDYFKGSDYTGTIFDDEALFGIEDAAPPFKGRFKPKAGNRLSVFDGDDAYGTWRLRIQDKYFGDSGTLDTFKLYVTVPEPATGLVLVLGVGFLRWHKHR